MKGRIGVESCFKRWPSHTHWVLNHHRVTSRELLKRSVHSVARFPRNTAYRKKDLSSVSKHLERETDITVKMSTATCKQYRLVFQCMKQISSDFFLFSWHDVSSLQTLIWSSFTSAAAPEDARSTRVSSASNILRVKFELRMLIWFYKFWMTAIDISCESGFECIFSIRVERVLKLKWVHN